MNARQAKREACQIGALLIEQAQMSHDEAWEDDPSDAALVDKALAALADELFRRAGK